MVQTAQPRQRQRQRHRQQRQQPPLTAGYSPPVCSRPRPSGHRCPAPPGLPAQERGFRVSSRHKSSGRAWQEGSSWQPRCRLAIVSATKRR